MCYPLFNIARKAQDDVALTYQGADLMSCKEVEPFRICEYSSGVQASVSTDLLIHALTILFNQGPGLIDPLTFPYNPAQFITSRGFSLV